MANLEQRGSGIQPHEALQLYLAVRASGKKVEGELAETGVFSHDAPSALKAWACDNQKPHRFPTGRAAGALLRRVYFRGGAGGILAITHALGPCAQVRLRAVRDSGTPGRSPAPRGGIARTRAPRPP